MSGTVGVGVSYVFAVVFGLIAIGFAVVAFIPVDINSSNFSCNSDSDCKFNGESCQNSKCQHKKERKLWMLLITLLFLLMGFGIVWYSRWYNKWVHKSRTNAQIGATMTELNMLKNYLQPIK